VSTSLQPGVAQDDTRAESRVAAVRLFAGPGEMRARCRALDWAATPLGPVERWPTSLRTAAALVHANGFPTILIWGPELVQIYNDVYIPFLGVKHPVALGLPTHACWSELREQMSPLYARVLAGETVTLVEQPFTLRRRGPDQPPDDVAITLSYAPVRDEAGGVGGMYVTLFDVSAQVAGRVAAAEREGLLAELGAERERLRALLLQMPAPVALLEGPEHRFALVNDAYKRVSGGGRDVTGLTPPEAFPELAGSGIYEIFAQVYASGDPWDGLETLVRYDRDGTGVQDTWFNLRFEPVRDGTGQVSAILNFAVDVTEQVRARREVERLLAESESARAEEERARAQAEAANRSKSEFLAVMSHELRTPLNAIDGYTELLEMGIHGPVTDAQRTALGRIQASQRHLLGLIAGVLDYSRVEAGAVTYRLIDVPVAEAVAEAETLVAPQLRAKGLGYSWSGASPELRVRADREKLQQILLNLLGNAVKFTDARDGVPGRIQVTCLADADGRVRIQVRDTGEGIAIEQLERIFDPFVQADQRLTRPHSGVGLGLAISRDLARGMGGDLMAESTPGVGSTFTLTLPTSGPSHP
jgi:PAS domain S-box-containing protein